MCVCRTSQRLYKSALYGSQSGTAKRNFGNQCSIAAVASQYVRDMPIPRALSSHKDLSECWKLQFAVDPSLNHPVRRLIRSHPKGVVRVCSQMAGLDYTRCKDIAVSAAREAGGCLTEVIPSLLAFVLQP